MIEVIDLKKNYSLKDQIITALDGVTLTVEAGEIFGVVGLSGAGKSTLIRCINMLEKPTSGTIVVNGQEVTSLPPAELRKARQRIGMIFQHFNLLSSRTVAQNIAFPLEIVNYPKEKRKDRIAELLSLVGLMEKANAYPSQLSGGQKQRVGIARALASEPEVLLSDEATSALDPQTTTSILELLRDLNRRLGLTILLITHEMNVIRQICDRVAVLQDGRIIEQGTIDELITRPDSLISRALLPQFEKQTISSEATSVTITFMGEAADQPVLASLVRNYDIDVNIIAGNLQKIGKNRVGKLQVEISGKQVNAALLHLMNLGLRVEKN
ncbi:methionine ABC transporter ATP-binding protein [Leptolinea tardivitalis]|uniref:Methionine ABC transporter ATP-binding protein n=1 Tax=Leptolinea tardivitalis TaxID=229920 RepID=A0A0P6X7Q6_9CHLR|nr:ATP-binding cassette domain-containing protein [Leptolinea tardivitalis]KPL71183.1 methionine ABC transporter ATP-binding protein [Leptolinea tardivitalis]GAP22356.1 ABC-type metal ion transport system, ATPase component [Leptolinea tardivitalis]